MRIKIGFATLLVASYAAASPLYAQTATAGAKPRIESGFATDRLARIDQLLQHYVDENQIAGAVGLVMRNGRVVYERAFGWADKEAGRRMTTDAIFRIASQSKALTSTAILMLFEEGKIGLDQPVSHFIPQFAHTTVATRSDTGRVIVPAKRPI
ncbi:MAG TPA: serine hydrolase domain-containing protein, partial [Gemmatimonadaceae bacterium]|nr:serine hydrolase domain-containing protein [Gemmatimonadaceae bacterium]